MTKMILKFSFLNILVKVRDSKQMVSENSKQLIITNFYMYEYIYVTCRVMVTGSKISKKVFWKIWDLNRALGFMIFAKQGTRSQGIT